MLLITKDADGEFWSWDVAQFNGARETLVFLGIVVLQTNLLVDGLEKFAFLGCLRILETKQRPYQQKKGCDAIESKKNEQKVTFQVHSKNYFRLRKSNFMN